jgi:hypothetical protein
MIDIIILFFCLKKIGKLSIEKKVNPTRWKIITVCSWFICEGIGINMALGWLGQTEITTMAQATSLLIKNPEITLFGLFSGFGGYLLIKYLLERKTVKED